MNQADPATGSTPAQETTSKADGRARDHFWPYVDLAEQPAPEELAQLDPDLRDALYGSEDRPFSLTVVFPRFEGPDFDRAMALARQAEECREVGQGSASRVRARFLPSTPRLLQELFALVSQREGCEVLVDERPVPYARELWLPLVWFLIPR